MSIRRDMWNVSRVAAALAFAIVLSPGQARGHCDGLDGPVVTAARQAIEHLKPAGVDLGPAIPAADRALATGDLEPLLELLVGATQGGLRRHFAEAREARKSRTDDVAAGRRYVERYVSFIHYVEGLHRSARAAPRGHSPEVGSAVGHED